MDGLDFQLDIEQKLKGGEALSALEKTEAAFADAKHAADAYKSTLGTLDAALVKNTEKLAETRDALSRALTDGDAKQVQKLTAKFGELEREEQKLKVKIADTTTALDKQNAVLQAAALKVGKMKDAEKRDEKSDKRTEAYSKKVTELTGRVGSAADKIQTMGSELGTTGALASLAAMGAIALAVAVAVAAVAVVAGAAAFLTYAVGLAEVRKETQQTLRALTQSNETAAKLGGNFEALAIHTGTTTSRLTEITRAITEQRRAMGLQQLSAEDMTVALEGIATSETALGDTGRTQEFIDQLASGAQTADRLGHRLDAQFGDVLQQKMMGLGKQTETLNKNLMSLFGGLDTTGLERGFSRFVALFDKSTASGKAIQTMFETIFGPATGDLADRFFIGIERWVLKTELTVLVLGIKFKETWKKINDAIDSVNLGPLGSLRDMINSLHDPAVTLAGDFLAMANPISAILVEGPRVRGVFEDMGTSIGKAIKGAYDEGKIWLDKIVKFGSDIIDGIEAGLLAGEQKIVAAFKKVLNAAHIGGQKEIQAHSPSQRAMRELGEPIGEGTALGIEQSSDAVTAALNNMLQMPAANGGSSSSVSVSGNHFTYQGGGSEAPGDVDDFFDKVGDFLERVADQGGTENPA